MNTAQLLQLLATNRELIQRNNLHALEHFQMLKEDYSHITDEEVVLNMELNNSLAQVHFHSNYTRAVENCLLVISRFKNTSHKNLLARHYWLVGYCYAHHGDHERAEEYLLMALETCVPGQEPVYTSLKTDVLVALAMNEEFRQSGQEKSLEYLKEAIGLLHDEAFAIRRAACLMGMGNVCINMLRIDEALKHYHASSEIYERFFDLANMASVYSNLGTCYIELKNLKQAELYLEKSLELRMKLGSPDHLSVSYYNLALVHKDTDRLESAYNLLLKSREILLKTGNMPYLKLTNEMLEQVASPGRAHLLTTA